MGKGHTTWLRGKEDQMMVHIFFTFFLIEIDHFVKLESVKKLVFFLNLIVIRFYIRKSQTSMTNTCRLSSFSSFLSL